MCRYEEPEETWPDEEDDALAAERDAKVFEFLTAKMQSVQGASARDEGGAAAAAAAVVVTGAERGGRAAGPAAAEMANLDDVDFRYDQPIDFNTSLSSIFFLCVGEYELDTVFAMKVNASVVILFISFFRRVFCFIAQSSFVHNGRHPSAHHHFFFDCSLTWLRTSRYVWRIQSYPSIPRQQRLYVV